MNRFKPLDYLEAAPRWFGRATDALGAAERKALSRAAKHQALIEDPNHKLDESSTFGQRLADRVAAFGGSWTFIMLFATFLFGWAIINTEILGKTAFDPYPYIFLNLMLSMVAAMQAPIIMMSQQRQSVKDRQMAEHDYEVNLKAEIEIMALHEKIDAMRTEHLMTIITQQQTQIDLLTKLLESPKAL
ncbi:MAG: DUF1003 domain-containing protein [Stagnimonas sp.]|nr:DUF1003 domain-containing protein [Stagnimonas sp.]